MAQRPLSPKGGRSPVMQMRVPKAEYDELVSRIEEMGLDKSKFLRLAAAYALRHQDAVFGSDQEVASKAS